MAFFGERFRRDDEEDIWEELRQIIANPPSEQEIMQKKKAEQAWIDSVLEQAFPDEPKAQKEPYLTYEELMEGIDDKIPNGQATGMAVGINDLNDFKTTSELLEEFPSKENLKKVATEMGFDTEKVLSKENLKKAAGYGLMGASIIPATSGVASGGKIAGAIAKGLSPKLGRKIAQQIARGTTSGAVAGGVEGLGRGLVNDENVIKTTLQDTAIGGLLGGAGGAGVGNVQKVIRGNELRNLDNLNKYTKDEIKKIRKQGADYYNDYIQGTKVKRADIGDVTFGNVGINELKSRSLHNIKVLPDLKNQVRHGIKKNDRYDYARDDISNFNIIENNLKGKTYEYQIAQDKAQNINKFYNIKDITNKQGSPSTNWNHHPGSKENLYNIIPPTSSSLNPPMSNMQQNNIQPQKVYNGAQNNQQIPILETEEEWLKRLRRQRQRKGFFS